MSRLDRHVNLVRNKLFVGTLLRALAYALAAFGVLVIVNVAVDKLVLRRLPHWQVWLFVGLGLSVVGAIAYTVWRRPSRHQAALAIDERLGLKEKFSTALYVRPSDDPFAAAAVRDAEATADNVSLQRRFPVQFPRMMVTAVVLLVVAGVAMRLPQYDLFGTREAQAKQAAAKVEKQAADARKSLQKVIAEIDNAPRAVAQDEAIQAARGEVLRTLSKPIKDADAAQRTAQDAQKQMEAIKEKINDLQKTAQANKDMEAWRDLGKNVPQDSQLAGMQNALAKGDMAKAAEEAKKVADNFDKMEKKDQEKAQQDMQKVAQKLQDIAKDQKKQQDLAKQMQDMGVGQQQMQDLANAMQQAASGDKQAQQQVQQMANQIAQQLNQQQGLTQQQQQAISQQVQNLANQMQQNANNQQAAQQMAQAAQAMAQAMQQQANGQQGGQKPQGQQGAQQQQANQGGQQPGQQGGQQQGQQAGAQQMQQAIQQMQQAADDAAEVAAQQQQMAQNGGGNQGDQGDGAGDQPGGQQANAAGQGQGGQGMEGDPNQQGGQGGAGAGIADGGLRPKGQETNVGFKRETAPGQMNDKGKILASTFVKAMSDPGKSSVQLAEVVESAEKESTDEVEQERIPRPAVKAVRDYFDDLKRDVDKQPGK